MLITVISVSEVMAVLQYSPYCCPRCHQQLTSVSELRKHLLSDHENTLSVTVGRISFQPESTPVPLSQIPSEDEHQQIVLSQIWRQLVNMHRTIGQTCQRQKLELTRLRQDAKTSASELCAAQQLIELLIVESNQLKLECSKLVSETNRLRQALDKQLNDNKNIVINKDK